MRKAYLFFPLLLVLTIFGGCIVSSVHPFYCSTDDIIFDQGLVGRWKADDDDEVWEFTLLKEKDATYTLYLVTINDDNEPVGVLLGALVEIDGRRFMDLTPYDFEYDSGSAKTENTSGTQSGGFVLNSGENGSSKGPGLWFNNVLLFPTHTALQIRRKGDTLGLALIEYDWITERVEKGTFELAHETEDDRVLITASPEELQAFVRRYADDETVFEFDELLRQ